MADYRDYRVPPVRPARRCRRYRYGAPRRQKPWVLGNYLYLVCPGYTPTKHLHPTHIHTKHPKPRVHHKVDFHIWGHLRHSLSQASQGSEEANRPTSAGHPASGSTYLSVSQTYHSECTLKTVHSLHLSTRNMRLTLNLHDLVRSP